MALKPLRPCRHPGCHMLTRDGYCPAHKPKQAQRRESAEWHWMYFTPEWTDMLRPNQLLLEPFCRECARRGLRTPATRVDHKDPHRAIITRRRLWKWLKDSAESAKNKRFDRVKAD